MNLLLPITVLVSLVAALEANTDKQAIPSSQGAAKQGINTELKLKRLQGTWEGVQVGEDAKITIVIQGVTLHFHRDKNFWFKTTITLPETKEPKQLHATINDCAEKGSIGELVKAVYKIEDGKLTLATIGDHAEEVPVEIFETAGTRYELQKTVPKKKDVEARKDGATSG